MIFSCSTVFTHASFLTHSKLRISAILNGLLFQCINIHKKKQAEGLEETEGFVQERWQL